MTRHLTFTWLGLAWLLGCGSTVTIEAGQAPPTEPGPTEPGPTEPPPPGEPPDPPREPPPPPLGEAICGADAADPLLVGKQGDGAVIVRADGVVTPLDGAVVDAPVDAQVSTLAYGRGERAYTASSWYDLQQSPASGSLISAYTPDGTLAWQVVDQQYDSSIQDVDPAGNLLVHRYDYDTFQSSFVIISDAGSVAPIAGSFSPHRYAATGVIAGSLADGIHGWYVVATQAAVAAPVPTDALWTRTHVAGHYLALTAGPNGPRLHRLAHDASNVVDLVMEAEASALVATTIAGEWLLLEDTTDGRMWRVHALSGDVVDVPLVPPSGAGPDAMSYCLPAPVVGSSGAILMLGNAEAPRFHAYDPASAGWSDIGNPLAHIETAAAEEYDGTFLVHGIVGAFCPGPVGDPDHPDAIAGGSLQVLRPATGAHHTVASPLPFYVDVRPGGACVLHADENGTHVIDLVDDGTGTLPGSLAWWR